MRRAPGMRTLALLAALAPLSGCSVVHLGRSGPAASPAPASSAAPDDKAAQKEAERLAKESEREAKQREREAKQAEREAKKTGEAAQHPSEPSDRDPMSEARERAAAQPDEPWWPYHLAELQAKAGRPADAEASLRASLARDSGYVPALTSLSRTLYEQGRHEEALQLLAPARQGRVTMSAKERAAVLSGVALHEAALGHDAEARAVVAELSGDDAAAVESYLAARGAKGDAAKSAAAEPGRETAALENNRGIALLRAGDANAAAKAFERAIELEPTRAAPYYNLAILERWYRLDRTAATARFKQYWSLSHADPDSLYAELGRGGPPVAEEGNK